MMRLVVEHHDSPLAAKRLEHPRAEGRVTFASALQNTSLGIPVVGERVPVGNHYSYLSKDARVVRRYESEREVSVLRVGR